MKYYGWKKNLWYSCFSFERNFIKSYCSTLWCLKLHLVLSSFSLTFYICDFQESQSRILFWGSSHYCCFNDQFFHFILCCHLGLGWANQFHHPHISLSYNWRLFKLLNSLLNSTLNSSNLTQLGFMLLFYFCCHVSFLERIWTWSHYSL